MIARTILVALFLVAAVAGTLSAEETNPVLGKVGDFVLREADLDRIIASQPPEVQKRFQDDPRQKLGLVKEILTKKAVVAKAKKERFDSKPEIKEQLSYVYDNFISQEYLVKVVTAGVTVPEEDLKKFYQVNEKDFQIPEQVKVRHILIASLKEDRPEEKEKARSRAEGILLRLKKGEDFASLAREFSDDQNSAKKGGELAVITLGKTNSEEFEKAAFALKSGTFSNIVATSYGFHIIKLDERQEKRTASFSEARDFIYNKLKAELEQKKAQEFLEQAVKDAGLELTGELSGSAQDSSTAIPDNVKKNELKK
ncbi:MAG: peptidylprolyl isomerase [Desulfuromonadales bacterium]|nr:peptidylprolyl isomerase [Desulfuromonadales bacterium]